MSARTMTSMPNRLAERDQPVPAPARPQPGRLVPVGPGGARRGRRREDKPIFLSIGYAACHWCHVMERESFEDEATAARPERGLRRDQGRSRGAARPRPDLHGRRPGDDRQRRLADERLPDARRPAVLRRHVLPGRSRATACRRSARCSTGVAEAWRERPRRGRARRRRGWSTALVARRRRSAGGGGAAPTRRAARRGDRAALEREFDARNGGWGGAPKFPQPMTIEFLLRRCVRDRRRRGRSRWRAGRSTRWPTAASTTSSAAASPATRPTRSGSCRTSRRCSTTTPSSPGSTSTPGRSTGDARYRDGRRRRRSTTCSASCARADGAFAASQDADTDGEEGATYVWTRGRGPRGPRRRRGRLRGRLRRHRRRQLGGPDDPVAGPAAGGDAGPIDGRGARSPTARARLLDRRRDAAAAGPRRQGAGGLERAGDRGARRCRARRSDDADATRDRGREAARRDPRAGCATAGRPARVARGRTAGRRGAGRARGLRRSRRRPARAVRGDVRRALVRRRARARGRDPRPLRRPGRRLLRHRRRPRGARHPAEGPPGQRAAVGRRDGRDASCSGSPR